MAFNLDNIEELAFLALQLRNSEIEYQRLPSDKKAVAKARLKRSVAELDGWLTAYLKMKRIPDMKITPDPNPDFGSADAVKELIEAAQTLLREPCVIEAIEAGPVGIARHNEKLNIDYVIHFEKFVDTAPAAPAPLPEQMVATEDEVIELLKKERKTFEKNVRETMTIQGKDYIVVRQKDNRLFVTKPDGTGLVV